MYPGIDRNAVRKTVAPVLLMSGERSKAPQESIDDELERLLSEKPRKRTVIHEASHPMWLERPEACRDSVLEFLRGK
jgi:pimeloyl-ACP methyl ester carboxylesterase